ncbi:MAG TPA: lysophospholipid acyltransferase family protein [Verrucomicrobiota bacterium]|nr:lysophospholipid acyltransferase family protein [Verrucomicrobiota bacterium]
MHRAVRHPLRAARRLGGFGAAAVFVAGEFILRRWLPGRARQAVERAAWLQWAARCTLRGLGVAARHHGAPPSRGLLVCNHLGYLDIPVLAAAQPLVFVSKASVRWWPLFGQLAAFGGTLFLRRDRRGHVADIAAQFAPIIEGGTVIGLFPEGTSSGGHTVLPFKPSLLAPAAQRGWPVTPAWITYAVEGGTVAEDVAYWGDMTFAAHLPNVAALPQVTGHVFYGEPVAGLTDRKELARRLHAEVLALKERHGGALRPAAGT